MSYSYEEAGAIIGWHPSTIAKYAAKLGLTRISTGLGRNATSVDDDGLQAIWEAIEAHAGEQQRRRSVEKPKKGSTQVPEKVRVGDVVNAPTDARNPSEGLDEAIIIPRGQKRAPAVSPHFDRNPIGLEFNAAGSTDSISEEESPDRPADLDTPRAAIKSTVGRRDVERVNAMALRGLEVEIAAREHELATMKRARDVIARDLGSRRE